MATSLLQNPVDAFQRARQCAGSTDERASRGGETDKLDAFLGLSKRE